VIEIGIGLGVPKLILIAIKINVSPIKVKGAFGILGFHDNLLASRWWT
jgi:hypothetical protein